MQPRRRRHSKQHGDPIAFYLVSMPQRPEKPIKIFHNRLEVALVKLRRKVSAMDEDVSI